MAETIAFKYRAFLSYSHRDKAWGKWLHAALEGYRIDKDLVGRQTPAGPVPKTLRPIFRDREDFSAGHSLTEQTLAALEASQFLIVLCSPHAAQSEYVNEEIRRFKMLGRASNVIPVIIDGEPGDADSECFPPALRFKLGPDGALTDEREEPIAADARPQGDGKDIAKQKVVAGLLGLGLDEIVRRAERARRRRNRFWAALGGVFLLLAVAATGSAVYAWQQLKTNEAFLNATLRTATDIVNTAVAQAEKYNVPRTATLELLAKAETLFDDMARLGRPTPELRYQKASMLIEFARNYEILGDTNKWRARATEAYHLLAELAAEKPDDIIYQRELSLAYGEIGQVLLAQGDLPEALKAYRDGLTIRERLAEAFPNIIELQRDLSVSYDGIGDILVDQGGLLEALKAYRNSFAISQRLAKADPNNADWQYSLAASYNRIGNVLVGEGDLTEALKAFRDGLALVKRLAESDTDNTKSQNDLALFYGWVGVVLKAQGNLSDALKAFRDGLAIFERLAKADPNNTDWRSDLSTFYSKIGEVLMAQGNLPEALKALRDGLAVAERLAKADSNNARWQRELSVSYHKIGGALVVQGNLPEALIAYRNSLTISERLAKADRSNIQWQNDLKISIDRVGGLAYRFVLAHNFATALEVADQAIALAPDQIWLYTNRAHALMLLGRVDEARALYIRYGGTQRVVDDKSWDTVVVEDFAELRKAGLIHPLMDEIEAKFAAG